MSSDLESVLKAQKEKATQLRLSSASERKAKLKKLLDAIWDHEQEIVEATQKDFAKPAVETILSELLLITHETHFAMKHLSEWMRPKSVPSGLMLLGARSEIHFEPRGCCLILSPWNYPWQLLFSPLVAALAAGNTCVLKPSEITPHSSALAEKIVRSLFPEDEVCLVQGDASVAQALLQLPFDHIFFTGSPAVGKKVMVAAAQHLTTVTLELGGKSPAIVEGSADLDWAAERLVWGKWVNGGQTCVAPDTLYVERSCWPQLRAKIQDKGREYSKNFAKDLSSIVSTRHFERIQKMSEQASAVGWRKIEEFGEVNAAERKWPLQFFECENQGMAVHSELAREEIFGPLFPVRLFDQLDEVFERLRKEEKPLALYIFTESHHVEKRVIQETTSGGLVINDVLIHLLNPHLPFGGVNTSGHGAYHGEHGFLAFSHQKSVLRQGAFRALSRAFAPPYSSTQLKWARRLMRSRILKWSD